MRIKTVIQSERLQIIAGVLAIGIIFVCASVFGGKMGYEAKAEAAQTIALIDGEIEAQRIENNVLSAEAEAKKERLEAVQSFKIVSVKAFYALGVTVLIVMAVTLSFLAYTASKAAKAKADKESLSPLIKEVGRGLIIVSDGKQTVMVDAYTGQSNGLFERLGVTTERVETERMLQLASIAAKAESDKPVIVTKLQSANASEEV